MNWSVLLYTWKTKANIGSLVQQTTLYLINIYQSKDYCTHSIWTKSDSLKSSNFPAKTNKTRHFKSIYNGQQCRQKQKLHGQILILVNPYICILYNEAQMYRVSNIPYEYENRAFFSTSFSRLISNTCRHRSRSMEKCSVCCRGSCTSRQHCTAVHLEAR